LVSLLAALIVFSLIVLFHEFGHFLLAKRGGICVVEFSLGMGPRLFSFVKGGTRYSLKLLPFGGSCMMLGEDEGYDAPGETEKGSSCDQNQSLTDGKTDRLLLPSGATGTYFNAVSAWTRFKVVVAGPVFNFILAWFCAFFVISCVGFDPASVVSVEDGYPAQEAGLQAGDTIERLNGTRTYLYRDVQTYLQFHPGKSVTVEYVRDGKSYTTQMVPRYSEEAGRYLIGISGGVYRKPASVIQTAQYSFYEVRYWIRVTFSSLGMILKRQVSSNDIAGPVRIVSMIGTTVKESQSYGLMIVLVNLANMCILLSANLGVMNLLPIPALDGGRLVFIILEMLRGKPVDPEKEGMVHMVGMAALMTLMLFVLFNDIRNLL
jgi:regulator of sigma E protease